MKNLFAAALAASLSIGSLTIPAIASDDTLYHDLGGKDGIARIVDDATEEFLSDKRIRATFSDTNMDRFKRMLAAQLCEVSGGPCQYKGHSMYAAHRGLHLRNSDFNALVEDLQKGMDTAGIPFSTQNRLLARLAPMQHDIVTR